jgi:FAD/FMN-containing dehydrogenase
MKAETSWGRLPYDAQHFVPIYSRFPNKLPQLDSMLPFGNGRSYGDVCLNSGGSLLITRDLDRFIAFDSQTGVIDCESGVLLKDIIELALPHGWFPSVVPGTAFVTVGGAIANDIHGKNHHRAGTFCKNVLQLELWRSDGAVLICTPTENSAWFRATVGGMGLTGLIVRARIQLRKVVGPWLRGSSQRFAGLREFLELSSELDACHEYSVAWIDCCASGRSLGRGVYMCGDHAADQSPAPSRTALHLSITPPVSIVNATSLRLFNHFYYHRRSAANAEMLWHFQSFLFPLDSVLEWNRMYGPKGFFQYQCVLPDPESRSALEELLRRIAKSGMGSFLVVLKRFGSMQSAGMMSFPRQGVTLALDFPNRGQKTLTLLDSLDEITRMAGGAVYPAKDARMSAMSFQQYFPAWREFRRFIDPRFSSSFWRRVAEESG